MTPQDFTEQDKQRAFARAIATLQAEGEAVLAMCGRLNSSFALAVEAVLGCSGRLVITGMGKSGAIGRKLAGTFASTGTPSLFLHPAEGIHGDLGMVTSADIVLAISNSGESEEIAHILPAIGRIGAKLIAMVGRPSSSLGGCADIVLDTSVEREACPLGLAPTTSTTVQLALGDALALAVMEARRFSHEDYALYHPGGALGRKLLLRVSDVMRSGDEVAVVQSDVALRDVLFAITRAGAGAACVVDGKGLLLGIITDGDVRRALLNDEKALSRLASQVMSANPRTISPDRLATEGLRKMEGPPRQIGEMPVMLDGKPVGMLMLKDLVAAGIV
ncbi:MAG: KpsF/GutQ family sugar-phosphate isomerase [Armatimonadetes bacterium]|nr:KpsF/GutQ family sugar-phosphate isomerase [Armatimonadota bacterium]